jgi:hypothetical protein
MPGPCTVTGIDPREECAHCRGVRVTLHRADGTEIETAPARIGADGSLSLPVLGNGEVVDLRYTARLTDATGGPRPKGGYILPPGMTFAASCTGLTAAWCGVHGDCTCDRGTDELAAPTCPLHGADGSHPFG